MIKKQSQTETEEDLLKLDEQAKPTEIISLDVGAEGEETPDLDEETTLSLLEDALEEKYADQIAEQTTDEAIQESFAERQALDSGHHKMEAQRRAYNAKSAKLTAGDIDAAWTDANVGEETPGGMNPTPDQDMVDEIGEALGITYEDDEPLDTEGKLVKRDQQPWELNPDSVKKESQPT